MRWQGVLHLTGGGSLLLSDLLRVPGASNTVLEATVPYASQALSELLGSAPEQAASAHTGRALSTRLPARSGAGADHAFGIGLTASLASAAPKKGQTRAHWAIQMADKSICFELLLDNAESRSEQELQLNEALWATIELALIGSGGQHQTGQIETREYSALALAAATYSCPHATCTHQHDGRLLLPGSFNPVHDGHREMSLYGSGTGPHRRF